MPAQNILSVNGKDYTLINLLGKGKSGYSYLVADDNGNQYVIKQIHHEPCDYYQFGNKLDAEVNACNKLTSVGINIPKLIEVDEHNERLLKEYIEGATIYDLILQDQMKNEYISQIEEICRKLYAAGLNIDYFPTNFVVKDDILYYIDYEFNLYSEQWNFENWGVKYWSKTDSFLKYVSEHQ